jgi:hypothetical protein
MIILCLKHCDEIVIACGLQARFPLATLLYKKELMYSWHIGEEHTMR